MKFARNVFLIAGLWGLMLLIGTIGTLYLKGQLQLGQFAVISPDFILGLLFIASFIKTADRPSHNS